MLKMNYFLTLPGASAKSGKSSTSSHFHPACLGVVGCNMAFTGSHHRSELHFRSSECKKKAKVRKALRAGGRRVKIMEFLDLPDMLCQGDTTMTVAKKAPMKTMLGCCKEKASRSPPIRSGCQIFSNKFKTSLKRSTMGELALHLKVLEGTARQAAHQDLRYKSCTVPVLPGTLRSGARQTSSCCG